MYDQLSMWVNYFSHAAQMILLFGVIFTLLSKLMPCNPEQPILRKDLLTDVFYYLFSPFLQQIGRIVMMAGATLVLHSLFSEDTFEGYFRQGFGPAGKLPVWVQAAIVFILSDILLYWLHRWFHSDRMWRFHAIHHSSEHVDWLSTHRFHFVNIWLSFTLVDVLMLSLGFSPEATACMGTFNLIYSAMVHANLNWTFGPFKYVFASPVFHRWHHTKQKEGVNKNFAPTFPLLDIMFGTFYMPEGQVPVRYGVSGMKIPNTFLAQQDWPFRKES